MVGRVVSTKMSKTVTVIIESEKIHPLYKKGFARSKKYLAHDPIGVVEGDVVEIVKVRPISKRKHWQVTKVVGKDIVALGTKSLAQAAQEAIEEVLPVVEEVENVIETEIKETTEEKKVEKEEVKAQKEKGKAAKKSK